MNIHLLNPQVSAPTPRKQNGCPPKPMITPGLESVFINEVGRICVANQSAGRFFVELMGPPLVNLQGFVLVFVKKGNKELSVSLTSASMGKDGMYLVDNVFGAGERVHLGMKRLNMRVS